MNLRGLLICFWSMWAGFFYPRLNAASSCVAGDRAMADFRFPAVIKGYSWFVGKRIDLIDAWSFRSGQWSQVPIQIDEVNFEGNYVLEEGLPYTKDTDDRIYDENDEFSIKGKSLGDSFDKKKIPKFIVERYKDYNRIDFCGEKNGYLGSILVAVRATKSPGIPFVPLFNKAAGSVETSKYKYTFRRQQPMLMGDVLLKTEQGIRPVFAGSSFVMPLVPKIFIFPSIYFGEQDFTSEIECWRSGSVRSIVAVGSRLRKFFKLLDLHLFSELVFYEDYFQIPTKIEFVFDPSTFLDRGSGLSYVLKYPTGGEWTLTTNLEPLPKDGPIKGDLKQTAFEQSPRGSYLVRGSNGSGSFMANVRVDQKALKLVPPPYLALENDFKDDDLGKGWPWLKKSNGSIAVFIDISGVKRGMYDFALDVALSNQAHDEFTDFQAVSAIWHDSTEF